MQVNVMSVDSDVPYACIPQPYLPISKPQASGPHSLKPFLVSCVCFPALLHLLFLAL